MSTAQELVAEARKLGDSNKPRAIELCDQAIAADPTSGMALFYRAFYMPANTDADQIPYLEKALQVNYKNAWTYQNLANCYMAVGRLTEAIDTYHKAIEMDQGRKYLWSLIGLLYEQMGNKPKALEFYDLCIEKSVDLGNTYMYLGKLRSGEGKYEEALKLLEIGLTKATNIELLYQNGKVCRILGQEEKALGHFNKAITIAPQNPNDWCNRGLSFLALNRKDEGMSDLKRTRSELETFTDIIYSPGYRTFMSSTITSILEAEELGQKSKAIEEKLQTNAAASKFKSVLKKLQDDKDTMQNKLIGQLSQTQNKEADKNIDDFNKLKQEFEKKLQEMQAAMMQEIGTVKKDVTTLNNKVTNLENNMEAMKEELNNKLDDWNRKLKSELAKQDLSPEDQEKLLGYFKAFVGTVSSIHVTSQVVDSGQVQLDAGNNATTILSTLASFAPFFGDALSSTISSVGEFLQTKEMKKNARKMKGLAPDASALSQLLGESAYKILTDKKKQQEVIKTTEQDMKQSFGNVFQKVIAFCEKLGEDLDAFLYTALYKTPAEMMGHQDANTVIEKWIKGDITPLCIQDQFVDHILHPEAHKAEVKSPAKKDAPTHSACCTMF